MYILNDENTIGVDESGRGTLFGNVIAGAVIMPYIENNEKYKEIKDSKKMSFKKRKELSIYIKENAITYGIGISTHDEVDDINILKATMKAMNRALNDAYKKKEFTKILIDGNYFTGYIPSGYDKDIVEYECIPKGDNLYLNIAAASIIAKDYHDNEILELLNKEKELEKYDLKNNKGYATEKHRNAIKEYGFSEYHRKTFKFK